MLITERRLRSIIREVIENSEKEEELESTSSVTDELVEVINSLDNRGVQKVISLLPNITGKPYSRGIPECMLNIYIKAKNGDKTANNTIGMIRRNVSQRDWQLISGDWESFLSGHFKTTKEKVLKIQKVWLEEIKSLIEQGNILTYVDESSLNFTVSEVETLSNLLKDLGDRRMQMFLKLIDKKDIVLLIVYEHLNMSSSAIVQNVMSNVSQRQQEMLREDLRIFLDNLESDEWRRYRAREYNESNIRNIASNCINVIGENDKDGEINSRGSSTSNYNF